MASAAIEINFALDSPAFQDFQQFKQKILESTLFSIAQGSKCAVLPHLTNGESASLGLDLEHQIPDWLRIEHHLIDILELLNSKNAIRDFINIVRISQTTSLENIYSSEKIPQKAIDLLPIFEKQDPAFFQRCGKLLLLAAIATGMFSLTHYLLTIREISPNFDFGPPITTPIAALIRNSRNWNAQELINILLLLFQKNCNLNGISSEARKPLDIAANSLGTACLPESVFQKMLELGASPFTFANGIQKDHYQDHPLKETFRLGRFIGVEMLLHYGAGLMHREYRLLPSYSHYNNPWASCSYYPHCTFEYLRNEEIVFQNCLKGLPWIYTVSDLIKMLGNFDKFSPPDLKRMDTVCNSVISAVKSGLSIFPDGIVAVFETYRKARTTPLLFCNQALSTQFSTPLRKIVLGFMESNEALVNECTKPAISSL